MLHGLRAAIVGNAVNRLFLATFLDVMRGHDRLADTAFEQYIERKVRWIVVSSRLCKRGGRTGVMYDRARNGWLYAEQSKKRLWESCQAERTSARMRSHSKMPFKRPDLALTVSGMYEA